MYSLNAMYRNPADSRAACLSAPDGTIYDAASYAILHADWQAGTITPPDWDDEPSSSC
jgi:hypothetical protein